jgi:hypothetical protein
MGLIPEDELWVLVSRPPISAARRIVKTILARFAIQIEPELAWLRA